MRSFTKCRCCLEDGTLKDMWSEYMYNGETEIYGAMLLECFSLEWRMPPDAMDYICEKCIDRLRDAFQFRKEVMINQDVWDEFIEADEDLKDVKDIQIFQIVREDDVEDKPGSDHETKVEQEQGEEVEVPVDNQAEQLEFLEEGSENEHQEIGELNEETGEVDEVIFETGEELGEGPYVDDDSSQDWRLEENEDMEIEYLEDEFEGSKTRRTYAKKRKGGRNKEYKKYTQMDLMAAIEMVKENKMSRSEAALAFNVPVKTLSAKIRAMESEPVVKVDDDQLKQNKFYDEIRTLLTYTNITPYKTRIGKYFCAYCSSEGPEFTDPIELRLHTRTQHAIDRVNKVDVFMRPSYLNEILKVDIFNLHCTVCMAQVLEWNAMFQHLSETHSVELDQAYTRVIPYVLTDELQCALCTDKFPHFHMLDCHMNAHYNNYICGDCGDTFISESRLKKHTQTHSTEQFPCSECGKVFTLDKYRKKHFDGVHSRRKKFRCLYCSEKFAGEYNRHLHLLEKHPSFVKQIFCELCDASFTWRPYYLKHMRLTHQRPDKKLTCKICARKFHQRHELKNHMQWHQGEGFTCGICFKKFSSKNYLQKHMSSHSDDEEQGDILVIVNDKNEKALITSRPIVVSGTD